MVCKRGALGCSVFEGDIPDDLDSGLNVYGVRVEVLNVLGAGDAFMSGLIRGYINNEGWGTILSLCKCLWCISGISPRLCSGNANKSRVDNT